MSGDTLPDPSSQAAQSRGPVPAGGFRVVVLEADGEFTVRDFPDREQAQRYADDAASESDGPAGSPFSYVFDDNLQFVDRGSHYASRA